MVHLVQNKSGYPLPPKDVTLRPIFKNHRKPKMPSHMLDLSKASYLMIQNTHMVFSPRQTQ